MSAASTREPPSSAEPGTAQRRHVDLVRQAILAASSHNTHPWKFRLEPDAISILPDLTRRCPAVDPDDHHLYASLGCTAENLLIAAQAAGLKGHVSYLVTETGLRVEFAQMTPLPTDLFRAIPKRQCSTSNSKPVRFNRPSVG